MNGTLDDRYLEWLYGQIGSVRNKNPSRSFWKLARQLYTKEFVWNVPNDDNRVEDGRDLRLEFLDQYDEVADEWLELNCSMLEMLIALSRRAAFEETSKTSFDWFWTFLQNIDIDWFSDKFYDDDARSVIDSKLDTVIYRRYAANGRGGIFPLKRPDKDQRNVELWYQLAAYLLERFPQ